MARKNYSDEFRRQAVDLYESSPGATLRGTYENRMGLSIEGRMRGGAGSKAGDAVGIWD